MIWAKGVSAILQLVNFKFPRCKVMIIFKTTKRMYEITQAVENNGWNYLNKQHPGYIQVPFKSHFLQWKSGLNVKRNGRDRRQKTEDMRQKMGKGPVTPQGTNLYQKV